MKIYDYLWAAFILGGLFWLLVHLLRRRQMPKPPERKRYGDEDEDLPK